MALRGQKHLDRTAARAEKVIEEKLAALSISPPDLRNSCLTQVATIWLKSDPAAARTWLANAKLPVETKNRLLNP